MNSFGTSLGVCGETIVRFRSVSPGMGVTPQKDMSPPSSICIRAQCFREKSNVLDGATTKTITVYVTVVAVLRVLSLLAVRYSV